MDVMAYIGRAVLWLYPPRCLLCGDRGQSIDNKVMDLCEFCEQQLPWNRLACPRCALPLPPGTTAGVVCGACQRKPPAFDCSFSLFHYEQPVVWLIHQLKFNQRLSHARVLGELLADRLGEYLASGENRPECILPVPLHNRRLRQRGFNQSIELGRAISKRTGLPMLLHHVERLRNTESQTGLAAKQRRKNIRDAFKVAGTVPYKHIAIIDDVVTTGSTVNELARVLKKAGVERVDVWSVARAPAR